MAGMQDRGMLTIRQAREIVAGLIHRMPEAAPSDLNHKAFFGGEPTLEATISTELTASLDDIEGWPGGMSPTVLPHVKMRLMFAAECLRQMEEAHPDEVTTGHGLAALLKHLVLDQWPEHGRAWAVAVFGPRWMIR